MVEVKSVNMLVTDMWSRLWANAFLLRKQQYFLTHTYEGRLNTPLRGDWDLEGGPVVVELPGDARREITPRFALVDTRHPAFVRAELGDGWHPGEYDPKTRDRWAWTRGSATLRLHNPHTYPLILDCSIDGWSAVRRPVALTTRTGSEPAPTAVVTETRGDIALPSIHVPPGTSTLTLQSLTPPTVVPGDPRPLGVAVFRFRVTPRR
jgi:hypothetical protein